MVKLFVIDSADLEYHIYAMDIDDALNTYDGAIEEANKFSLLYMLLISFLDWATTVKDKFIPLLKP